jgi:hypothetical protein
MVRMNVEAELKPDQKATIRQWSKPEGKSPHYLNTRKISDHAMGSKSRVTFPIKLDSDIQYRPSAKVTEFLYNKGYKYHEGNYRKGIAHKIEDYDNKRPLKIGKLLEKHEAPEHIKKAYMNDPARSNQKNPNVHVTISRHPYDVASMSTDRGWTSCMDMNEGGTYATKHLPKDIEHGTHVAYLHHAHDKTISHPIARIAIKPLTSDSGHTILKPEGNTYGVGPKEFHKAVNEWTDKHFTPHKNKIYLLHNGLYDDEIPKHVANIDSNHAMFDQNHLDTIQKLRNENREPIQHSDYAHVEHKFGPEHQKLIDGIFKGKSKHYFSDEKGKKDRFDTFLKSSNPEFRHYLATKDWYNEGFQPKPDQQKQLAKDPNPQIRYAVASNRNFLPTAHKQLMNDRNSAIVKKAADSFISGARATDKTWQNLHKHKNPIVRSVVAEKTRNKDILHHLSNDPDENIAIIANHRLRNLGGEYEDD